MTKREMVQKINVLKIKGWEQIYSIMDDSGSGGIFFRRRGAVIRMFKNEILLVHRAPKAERRRGGLIFNPGDKVEILDLLNNSWRAAVILKKSSYQGRRPTELIYDFIYDPLPVMDPFTGIMPGQGGSASSRFIRPRL